MCGLPGPSAATGRRGRPAPRAGSPRRPTWGAGTTRPRSSGVRRGRRGAPDAESPADVFDVLAPPDGPRVAVLLHVPHSPQTSAGAYEPRGDVADQHHHPSSTHLTTSLRTKNSPARTGSPVSLAHCRAYASPAAHTPRPARRVAPP